MKQELSLGRGSVPATPSLHFPCSIATKKQPPGVPVPTTTPTRGRGTASRTTTRRTTTTTTTQAAPSAPFPALRPPPSFRLPQTKPAQVTLHLRPILFNTHRPKSGSPQDGSSLARTPTHSNTRLPQQLPQGRVTQSVGQASSVQVPGFGAEGSIMESKR